MASLEVLTKYTLKSVDKLYIRDRFIFHTDHNGSEWALEGYIYFLSLRLQGPNVIIQIWPFPGGRNF